MNYEGRRKGYKTGDSLYEPRYQITDPLYEPIDMSLDRNLCEQLAPLFWDLLETYELRRAQWIIQSGQLFEIYHGCTHTRRAHAIGCWCIGWYALSDIKVLERKGRRAEKYTLLRDWIQQKGEHGLHREFMAALLLHDIGHPPFSHALEFNPDPKVRLNHHDITKSLVSGEEVNGINWARLTQWELGLFKIRGRSANTCEEYERRWHDIQDEIKTVSKVLKARENERELLKRISPSGVADLICGPDSNGMKKYQEDGIADAIHALHLLVDSHLDIDRLDHFLRDSYFSGIRFADYKIRPFLQNIEIVTPGTSKYNRICEKRQLSKPAYIVVREEGLRYIQYLQTVREFMFDMAFWLNENLRLIGTLNQAVRVLVNIDRHLKELLPIFTDLTLLQYLRKPEYVGTTIEGYGRVLNHEIPSSQYKLYKLEMPRDPVEGQELITALYEKAEEHNESDPRNPKILLFSNFVGLDRKRGEEEDRGWGSIVLDEDYRPLCEQETDVGLFDWIESHEARRENNVRIWSTSQSIKELEQVLDTPESLLTPMRSR